jgi:hypothetical protein
LSTSIPMECAGRPLRAAARAPVTASEGGGAHGAIIGGVAAHYQLRGDLLTLTVVGATENASVEVALAPAAQGVVVRAALRVDGTRQQRMLDLFREEGHAHSRSCPLPCSRTRPRRSNGSDAARAEALATAR